MEDEYPSPHDQSFRDRACEQHRKAFRKSTSGLTSALQKAAQSQGVFWEPQHRQGSAAETPASCSTDSGTSQLESQPIDSLDDGCRHAMATHQSEPEEDEVQFVSQTEPSGAAVQPPSTSARIPGLQMHPPPAVASAGASRPPPPPAGNPVAAPEKVNVNSSVEAKLAVYRHRVKELAERKQAKPDMVAYKELSRKLTAKDVVGHIDKVEVGQKVFGKGELAILGIHTSILSGIQQKKGSPAFAIALAGGYADDDDTGAEFWYTGQGGQSKKGDQISDQSFKVAGNAALKKSFELQSPVRVVRRLVVRGQTMPTYIYEGLYMVKDAVMAQGTHGFQICRFKMVAVPGESSVSTKVLHGKVPNFKQARLASAGTTGKRKDSGVKKVVVIKKRKSLKVSAVCPVSDDPAVVQCTSAATVSISHTVLDFSASPPERPSATFLLLEDFSRGLEEKPIPVYGNSEMDIISLPKPFTYMKTSEVVSKAAKSILEWSKDAFHWEGDRCGIEVMGEPYVLADGRLTETLIRGLYECGLGSRCTRPECRFNRVITEGFKLPLEIFMTQKRGWGMRCSSPIQIGTFICEYAGEVCSDSEAEARPHEYLFDMDHFALAEEGTPIIAKLPQDAAERSAAGQDALLTIDGNNRGNLGRFLNHSCDGNVLLQPTFTAGSCPHLYRVALFAARDIAPFEELTYHYGWSPREGNNDMWISQGNPQREVWCSCGSLNCQGRLL